MRRKKPQCTLGSLVCLLARVTRTLLFDSANAHFHECSTDLDDEWVGIAENIIEILHVLVENLTIRRCGGAAAFL